MKNFIASISKEEVQDFIFSHEMDDVQKLLLKQKTILGVPTDWIAQQLLGRRKAKTKLDTWYRTRGIIYPPSLNLEQSSSEATGKFKSNLLKKISVKKEAMRGADLTGGFGIDTFFLSQQAEHIDYADPNGELLEIARHNHHQLGVGNITYHQTSAEAFLHSTPNHFDFLYLDPSRRKAQQKVFRLADSEPDMIALQSEIFSKAKNVLIKTSPLLDLQQGFKDLQDVAQIIVVAVENECKELLFLLQYDFLGTPTITAVDLDRTGETINMVSFTFDEESRSLVSFASPLTYLYEPNAAILKAGAFKWVAQHYHLKKLGVSTHLYTSEDQKDFPGRIFKILDFVKPDKKLKDRFANGYANILTRNYPMSVEEIKKKTGLKEGGEQYLICTQSEKEKWVMVAERIR